MQNDHFAIPDKRKKMTEARMETQEVCQPTPVTTPRLESPISGTVTLERAAQMLGVGFGRAALMAAERKLVVVWQSQAMTLVSVDSPVFLTSKR